MEKIRRELEMYRMQKENEIANLQKKEQKLETENKRLRGELQALQKTSSKLRHERDQALEAEHQALARASTFENDRDKVQRQFKVACYISRLHLLSLVLLITNRCTNY